MFLGKRFVITSSVMYVTNANILLDNQFVKTDGGIGGDVVLSYSFLAYYYRCPQRFLYDGSESAVKL